MSTFSSERLTRLLDAIGRIAGGNLDERIPLSSAHDELDAIGHAINVLVGELQIVASGLRRAKEDAEAASMAKTIFLRNVSHEIRTPLTVVLGMSDLIASRSVPKARVEELRERIAANGRALVTILDDLLDLAKIESTRINFELEPVQVSHLAGEVVESFEALAARKQVALVFESTGADDAHVLADPKRLRQILMNLIGNAVKFTEHGQIAVRVTESPGTRQVFVDIADTGIGMTPEQAHEVFEPFAQADATIARRYGGSGLGLAISKRFAQGMGGGLDVAATEPGRGTTFRLTLPATATATAAPPITSSTAREVAPLSALRVLVVEDHEDVRATTTELLTRAGAVVSEAVDGQDAIDAVQAGAFDAILMDIRMPRLDGIEATRRLRASGQTMPIIALTADAVPEQQAECLAAGCNGYLAKPLDLDQLVTLLGDAAAAHREAP
jgi:signal transduction histidine kinase/ActR/RegA family two-component response regulator